MIYLILYDISETKLRTKIAKLLVKEGAERIQYSVFVTYFNPFKTQLYQKITEMLKKTNEKFLIIPLTKNNFFNTKIIGNFSLDLEYLSGEKSSLIL